MSPLNDAHTSDETTLMGVLTRTSGVQGGRSRNDNMNRKIFAVMSVMIMLMAGLIVVTANGSDDTVATDPTPSDYAPTAFATDAATETFKVLAYKDKVLLIDTRAMTTLGDETNFYIGLTPDSVTVDHATEIMIGPLSLQNGRILTSSHCP